MNSIINFYLTPPRLVVTAFRQSTPPWEGNLDCAKNGAKFAMRLRSGVYRNGFGVLCFRNLACIPRPGRGDHEVAGRVEKKRTTLTTKDHPSAGGELAFCNPHKKNRRVAVVLSFLLFVFFLLFDCHCCQWACQHSLQANFIARYHAESVCAIFNSFQRSIYFL